MSTASAMVAELKRESAVTRKVLERIPEDKLDWSPHERSWSFRKMGSHVANLGFWMTSVLAQDEVDVADHPDPFEAPSVAELLKHHDEFIGQAISGLAEHSDASLNASWTLRSGDHVIFETSRLMALRFFIINHLIHHRGQLSVYLRLCDLPVPAIYGPSADEDS